MSGEPARRERAPGSGEPASRQRAHGRAVVALSALAAGVVFVHTPLDGSLTAHHDNLDGTAPLRMEAARQWKSGQIPLWNPWKRSGMPLLADTTAGAIDPLNSPFLFVETPVSGGSAASPVFRAMDQAVLLHALVAGVSMFVFLRVVGIAHAASVLGALVYAASGTMVWFAAWYVQIHGSVVWLPLILAAVHRLAASPAPRWIAIGALAVALQFFAGFPETSFYSGVIAIAYALALALRQRSARAVGGVAAIYVAGILLAAVQLFPSVELQLLSRRPAELDLAAFQSLPATAAMFRAWAMPSPPAAFEFPPLAAYHFGAAATAAAAIGLTAIARRGAFFAGLLLVGVVLSLGAATPVSAWLHEIPGFNAFRHPFKHLFEVSFAMAVLAAFGAQRVLEGRGAAGWRMAVVALAIVLSSVSLRANQRTLAQANPPGVDLSASRPATADLVEPGWRVLVPRQVFQPRDPAFLLGDYPSQYGVLAIHGAGPFLWSEMAEATGMVEEETTFRRGLFGARDRTLGLLSGRYLLQTIREGKWSPSVDPAVWSEAGVAASARLVQRSDALPRVRFVSEVRCATHSEIESSLRQGSPDPRDVALVDCGSEQRAFTALAAGMARIASDHGARIEIETELPPGSAGFLVLADSALPGWRAWADDQEVPVHLVHGLVRGVEVPADTRRIELAYSPASVRIGAATSAGAAIVLVVLALRRRRDEQGR